jgi:sphingolipid 4-desaturase/C4-monooxygenase
VYSQTQSLSFLIFRTFLLTLRLFTRYHRDHHQSQGDATDDVDLPSHFEGKVFRGVFMKAIWVLLQPLFYIIRPLIAKPKSPEFFDLFNWISCFVVDYYVYQYFGGKALVYLFISGFFGSSLHPVNFLIIIKVAGHFISEHYVFEKGQETGQETYSYYGPLNKICFNVGYHNEHHDFPRIPGSRLPLLKKIAPEYYENLICYDSWVWVMVDYIINPKMGPYQRVVRNKLSN